MEHALETGQNPRKNHKVANKIPENAKIDLASFDAPGFLQIWSSQLAFSIANSENLVGRRYVNALTTGHSSILVPIP